MPAVVPAFLVRCRHDCRHGEPEARSTNMDQHLLSIILITPLAGLLVLFLLPGNNKGLIRVWANLVGLIGFLISLPLLSRFQNGAPGFQFEEKVSWIPALGVSYHIGIDGISLLLIML